MDTLSQLFETLQVEGNIFFHSEFTAPWGFSQLVSDGAIFHVVKRGHCWLYLVEEQRQINLKAGDLILIRGQVEHHLLDDPASEVLPLKYLMDKFRLGEENGLLKYGGGGAATWLVCGEFHLPDGPLNPLLSRLPPLIHLQSEGNTPPPWLDMTLQYLARETESTEPGSRVVVQRLLDVLFIEVIRAWLKAAPPDELGSLTAFNDRQLGRVLAQVFQNPAREWTVAEMAQIAGLSRAAFATRFKELLGDSPLKYLTRWRMQLAAARLKADKVPVATVAASVGYASVAAFTRVFERYIGLSPAAYRANSKEASSPTKH